MTRRAAIRRHRRQRRLAHLLAVVLLLLVSAPFLWLLGMSLKTNADIFAMPPKLVFRPTAEHYVAVWNSEFPRALGNSAVISVLTTALAMLIGVPGAFALSRGGVRATGRISLWILATRMAPPIAFTLPFFLIYRHVGLLDTRTGLVVVYLTFNLSLVVWMMRSFFDATARSLDEAAWIDGAGVWEAFLRINLPLAAPGLAATAIFCFLFSWNDFFFALILTRTRAVTAPVAVVNFLNYEGWEWGKIAAAGTMVMLPVLVFSLLVRRYLVRGLTAGAIRG